MPVRPEEKPKAPTVKAQRAVPTLPRPSPEEDHILEHNREVSTYHGPVLSPLHKHSVSKDSRDVLLGALEGHHTVNGHERHSSTQSSVLPEI